MQEAQELTFMTFAEFEAMEKDACFNYELIDGVVMMSPRPTKNHQRIIRKLITTLDGQLDSSQCEALPEIELLINNSSIIPDLSIICDDDDKNGKVHRETPLIVMEILSPSTASHDLLYKLNKYQSLGVSEYWIIDPKSKSIVVHYFFNGTAGTFGLSDTAASLIRPEIQIELAKIFA